MQIQKKHIHTKDIYIKKSCSLILVEEQGHIQGAIGEELLRNRIQWKLMKANGIPHGIQWVQCIVIYTEV